MGVSSNSRNGNGTGSTLVTGDNCCGFLAREGRPAASKAGCSGSRFKEEVNEVLVLVRGRLSWTAWPRERLSDGLLDLLEDTSVTSSSAAGCWLGAAATPERIPVGKPGLNPSG